MGHLFHLLFLYFTFTLLYCLVGIPQTLVLKKLNTMGLIIESLCRDNQNYNISNELLELPISFLNKDEDLRIFPAANKNDHREIENKMQDKKFYKKLVWMFHFWFLFLFF